MPVKVQLAFEMPLKGEMQLKGEPRRANLRVAEKLKSKIRKLVNFWDAKQKTVPHLFKQRGVDEWGPFELIDLSFKGREGVSLEDEGKLPLLSCDAYEFSDINGENGFDFETM